jgi:hypothetical protein
MEDAKTDTIAFIRRLTLIAAATIALTAPGLSDDQKKPDKPVSPAQVSCVEAFYIRTQLITAYCGFARKPIDDAIDDAIAEIDEFALAHFPALFPPGYVTRQKMEDARRNMKQTRLFDPANKKNLCEEGGSDYFIKDMRDRDPDDLRKEVKELLSRPLRRGISECRYPLSR